MGASPSQFITRLWELDSKLASLWISLVNIVCDLRHAGTQAMRTVEDRLPEIDNAQQLAKEEFDGLKKQIANLPFNLEPEALRQEEELVDHYLKKLEQEISSKRRQADVLLVAWCMNPTVDRAAAIVSHLQRHLRRLTNLIERQRSMQPRSPRDVYQEAKHVLDEAMEHLLPNTTSHLPCVAPRIMLHGAGGMGKSCLVARIFEKCTEDDALRARYPDGPRLFVFGPCVGQSNKKHFLLTQLRNLQLILEAPFSALDMAEKAMAIPWQAQGQTASTEEEVTREIVKSKDAIRRVLCSKCYLLIVDDVWPEAAEMLLAECLPNEFKGACVVTSRWNLSEHFAAVPATIRMSNDKTLCEAVLAANAYSNKRDTRFKARHRETGERILSQCGDNAETLRQVGRSIGNGEYSWDTVPLNMNALTCNAKDKNPFAKSIRWLEDDRSVPAEGLRAMLATLKQLPALTKVPVDVVRAMWRTHCNVCNGCTDGVFDDILHMLSKASIVDKGWHDLMPWTQTICFHALLLGSLQNNSLAVPSWQSAQQPALDTMSATEPSAHLLAVSCTRLFGNEAASKQAADSLANLPEVAGEWQSAWWDNCQLRAGESVPLGALMALAAAHPVLKQLVVSAAVGRLWPALTDRLPSLMTRPDTAVVALTVLVGVSASDNLPWCPEYASAVETAAERAGSEEHASLLLLMWWGLRECGAWHTALTVSQRALHIWRHAYGEEDPRTLKARNHVARSFGKCGQHTRAVRELEELLHRQTNILGSHHADTLETMHFLSCWLVRCGSPSQALQRAQEALDRRSAALGLWHPHTVDSMWQVAHCWCRAGQYKAALKKLLLVETRCKKVLVEDHPRSLWPAFLVSMLWEGLGRHEQALQVRRAALPQHQLLLGPRHNTTTKLITNIGDSLGRLGQWQHALEYYLEALHLRIDAHGERDVEVFNSYRDVATALERLGQLREVTVWQLKALPPHQDVLGAHHGHTCCLMQDIADSLAGLGCHEEALVMDWKAWLGCAHDAERVRAMLRIATHLDNLGQHHHATKLRDHADAVDSDGIQCCGLM